MPTYMILFSFTQKGEEGIAELPLRVDHMKQVIKKLGGEIVGYYAILGSTYDTVCILKAPTEEKAAEMALGVARRGNVRAETHRLFTEEEVMQVVAAVP